MGIKDFFTRKENKIESVQDPKSDELSQGLAKTREGFLAKLGRAVIGKSTIDDDFLDQLEEILITSDVGVTTTLKIIDRIKARVSKDKFINSSELNAMLKQEIVALLSENKKNNLAGFELGDDLPYVIMVVGVNGVGKTTTIGKLAHRWAADGKKVVIGAGDTFRAAAVDQLKIWADRSQVILVQHGMNTDPASVAFDAVKTGIENNADVIIIDTAGRLHNKVGLMNELSKIKRVMEKHRPGLPQEVLLVLDGSTGQNAFEQAKLFTETTQVNALAITKLDGTAKGGVVLGICDQFNIPVKYIGVGEGVNHLKAFDAVEFVDSLFAESK